MCVQTHKSSQRQSIKPTLLHNTTSTVLVHSSPRPATHYILRHSKDPDMKPSRQYPSSRPKRKRKEKDTHSLHTFPTDQDAHKLHQINKHLQSVTRIPVSPFVFSRDLVYDLDILPIHGCDLLSFSRIGRCPHFPAYLLHFGGETTPDKARQRTLFEIRVTSNQI